jgi:hypothetical protein
MSIIRTPLTLFLCCSTVTNAAGLIGNASALVTVSNVAPRILSVVNATIAGNATAGTAVIVLSPVVWVPYASSVLRYSLVDGGATTAGLRLPAFNLTNASTGAIAVANVGYTSNATGRFVPGPDFNQNVQPVLTSGWVVVDSFTGLAALGSLVVTLRHSNRGPYFSSVPPVQFAPQARAGPFGSPLSLFVTDLDMLLGTPGEWTVVV